MTTTTKTCQRCGKDCRRGRRWRCSFCGRLVCYTGSGSGCCRLDRVHGRDASGRSTGTRKNVATCWDCQKARGL